VRASTEAVAISPWRCTTGYRLFAMQPFATVEADFNITGSVCGIGMIEWMSGDGTKRITVSAKRHSGMIAAELLVSGSSVASFGDTAADLDGDFTLIAQMQGRSVLVWHRKRLVTTYIGRLDFTSQLDLRDPTNFNTWTLGITARGHTDMQVRCSRFEANLTGNGHADPRIVSYEDGTPIQDGTTVWFLATTRGGHIPDAFQGSMPSMCPAARSPWPGPSSAIAMATAFGAMTTPGTCSSTAIRISGRGSPSVIVTTPTAATTGSGRQ